MRTRSRAIHSLDDLEQDTQSNLVFDTCSTQRSDSIADQYIQVTNYSMEQSQNNHTFLIQLTTQDSSPIPNPFLKKKGSARRVLQQIPIN